ncbi:MAG: MarR family transcriptional regulator [Flavonifractor plautii]
MLLPRCRGCFWDFCAIIGIRKSFRRIWRKAFYIRRSTASRLLKRLEEEGFVMRCSVSRDARLKQLMATPKRSPEPARVPRITRVEAALTKESALRSCSSS